MATIPKELLAEEDLRGIREYILKTEDEFKGQFLRVVAKKRKDRKAAKQLEEIVNWMWEQGPEGRNDAIALMAYEYVMTGTIPRLAPDETRAR